MRVTNKMLAKNYLRDQNNNLNNLSKINTQLASGKEISRPSDDPFKVARSMQLNRDINKNKQYNSNITDTTNWLDTTDSALEQVTNIVQRVRELMVSSGNAAYGSQEANAISDEINERVGQLAQVLNTNFDGKYIFGGTKTTSKPLQDTNDPDTGNKVINFIDKNGNNVDLASTDDYNSNLKDMLSGSLKTEISQGVTMDYNVTAMDIFMYKDSEGNEVNALDLFKDIVNNLTSANSNDRNKVTGANLTAIDDFSKNLLKVRAEVGALQNRMESAADKNEAENYNLTDILSKNEDIDFAEKLMQYNVQQTVYNAALQVSGRVLPSTLLQYLG